MIYLSVDIEADGPAPGEYSLRSIGAVPVILTNSSWALLEDHSFYVELEPVANAKVNPQARVIFEPQLDGRAMQPIKAMQAFKTYLEQLKTEFHDSVMMAAKPIVFDGAFINHAFWSHLGENPLGYKAFDIGSFLEGLFSIDKRTRERIMLEAGYVEPVNARVHHALHDAIEQGQTLAWALNFAHSIPRRLDSIM
jgi:ribonuclease T